jgi:ABC-2 type transport system permease protein
VRRNSLIGWSVALAAAVIMYVALFPSIQKIDLNSLMQQYPKELLRAFGFDTLQQLNTAIGFLNTELFGFMLPLAIIFLPIGVVVHVIPRAEERGYLDALLSAPIARWYLVIAAGVAATLSLLIPIVVMILTALLTAQLAGVHLTLGQIGGSAISLLPMGALAGSIACVVVGATRRHGVATAVAAGIIVVMYLMQVLAGFLSFFDSIKGVSVFYYYSGWINHGIQWVQFFAILGVAAVFTGIGALLFERRDVGT